ncbi:hypothetical protein [Amycolatopsis pigmentata]|uniref:Uncharacterized protein n=1 Tax=Amycolatopsis pigmentata TaxID=450801 RepID=A0ABW5G1G1_9PSEU
MCAGPSDRVQHRGRVVGEVGQPRSTKARQKPSGQAIIWDTPVISSNGSPLCSYS